MTDREKIVKELYDLRRYLEDKEWSDNRVDRRTAKVYWQTVTDAIAMLKEQENKKTCCRDCEYYGACHDE